MSTHTSRGNLQALALVCAWPLSWAVAQASDVAQPQKQEAPEATARVLASQPSARSASTVDADKSATGAEASKDAAVVALHAGAVAAAAGELSVVTVTGARAERLSKEVPATVEQVNREALDEKGIDDIRELARELPNVEVERRSNRMVVNGTDGRANNAGFNIRGLDGNRVLMLVDGVRMPRSYSFGGASRDNVDMGLMERVEVVKGPSSALYGSDGIGGVVQFFTRNPDSYVKPGKTFGGQAAVSYAGDDKAFGAGATLAGKPSEQLAWLLSFSGTRSHELSNRGSDDSPNINRTKANPEDAKHGALLGKLVLTPNASQRHTLAFEHVQKQSDIELLSQVGYTARGVTTTWAEGGSDSNRNRLSWQGQWKNLNQSWVDAVHAHASYQAYKAEDSFANERINQGPQVRLTTDRERTLQAGVQLEKRLLTGNVVHKLNWGFDLMRTEAKHLQDGLTPPAGEVFPLKRFPDTTDTSYGIYVQNEIVGDGWSLIPGLRWDHYRLSPESHGFTGAFSGQSGSAFSPRLGATLDLHKNWTAYGQYATGFRTPSADQVNRFFENTTGYYMTVPNPNLKPEKARHLELGIKGSGEGWMLDVAGFYGRYNNFIEDNQHVGGTGRPGDPLIYQSVNVGRITIRGFEVKGLWTAGQWMGGEWSLPFTFGMAKGRVRESGAAINSVQPARLTLGARYAQPNWSVRLDVTHRAAKKAKDANNAATQFLPPSSTTLDLSGQWTLRQTADRSLRVTAGVRNLTDRKYWRWSDVQGLASNLSTLDAYSQPGRSAFVSLVADF